MNMRLVELGIVLALALLALAAVARRRSPAPALPAGLVRVSALCVIAFLFAVVALVTAAAAVLCAEAAALGDLPGFYARDAEAALLAAEVLRLASIVPALAALGFAIAGRGSVRESGGALRGRALYGAAVLIALGVGLAFWASFSTPAFIAARPGGP
jgi:hypothetical protein